jgi:hypothetical protein
MRYWKPKPIVGEPKLAMMIASYLDSERLCHALECLLHSFGAQTYPHWEAHIVHDGPLPYAGANAERFEQAVPGRVKFFREPKNIGHFGHKYRRRYALKAEAQYIGFTNQDNYYAPTYFEWLISELQRKKAEFAYCDMVHSHKTWKPMTTAPRYRHLDVGGFIVTQDLVRRTEWRDFSFKGDGTYINELVGRARGVVKVPATLFVHN